MNKIRCFFLFVFGGLLSATVMEAQEVDFEKEFDDFQKQQLLCRLLQTNRFRGYMYRDSLICL